MISAFTDLLTGVTGPLVLGTALGALVLGLASLFYGRRLYWLFVGLVGFLLGLAISPRLLTDLSAWWQALASFGLAVVFALLSVGLNQLMITLSGGIGLAIIGYAFAQNVFPQWAAIAVAVVSAIIGVLIAWLIFDWGLMIISGLAGAALVTSSLRFFIPGLADVDIWIFAVLAVIGLAYQFVDWSRQKNENPIENDPIIPEKGVIEKAPDQDNQPSQT